MTPISSPGSTVSLLSSAGFSDLLMLGIIVLDPDGRVAGWNSWMQRHSGLQRQAALGCSLDELFGSGVSPNLLTAVEATLKRSHSRILTHAVHGQLLNLKTGGQNANQGEAMALNLYLVPVREAERGVHCLIQVFDVTGSARREKSLQEEVYNNRRSSLVDDLTGQLNRRAFDIWLAAEWRRLALVDEPVTVMMLDVDQFKLFNDMLGHVAGDECLRRLAHTLAQRINRPGDALFRYGGEEFAVLLTTTDKRGAAVVAASLIEAVRGLEIMHPATHAPVTISIGYMAGKPVGHARPEDYVRAADAALYAAKNAGRNRAMAHAGCEITEIDPALAGRQAKILDRELMD